MQNTDKSLVIRKYWKSSMLLDFYNRKSFMEKMYLDCTMNVQKKLLGMSVTQYFNFAVRGDPLNFTDNGRHLLCSYWSAAFERFTKFGVFINPFFVINGKKCGEWESHISEDEFLISCTMRNRYWKRKDISCLLHNNGTFW